MTASRRWFLIILLLLLLVVACCSGNHHDDDNEKQPTTAAIVAAAKRLLMEAAAGDDSYYEDDLRLLLKEGGGLNEDLIETLLAKTREEYNIQQQQEHDDDEEESNQCYDDSYAYYADRHIRSMLETYQDYDCLEREFDVMNDSTFDVAEAIDVFDKCHLLVLRNVFSKQQVHSLRSKFSTYIHDVYSGKIKATKHAATTHGGDSFVLHEGNKRWNILPPRNLVGAEIYANPTLIEILSAFLSDDLIVNHVGNINAEAGAQHQHWHSDGTYLYGEDSLVEHGVAGHDLPPYAINMFTPLLDITTNDLGPTEFCLGTSNLRGLSANDGFYHVLDNPLLENGVAEMLYEFDQARVGECPTGFSRVPLLNMGDVVLVDYLMTHRGGTNRSNNLRSLLFITYSKKWYHDSNFDISNDEEDDGEANRLTKWTRFALVEEVQDHQSCPADNGGACENNQDPPPPLESISKFLQTLGWDDEEVEQNYYQNAAQQ